MHPSSAEKLSLLLFLCFQSRPIFPPPPCQVLVHGQGLGREEVRPCNDFGVMMGRVWQDYWNHDCTITNFPWIVFLNLSKAASSFL